MASTASNKQIISEIKACPGRDHERKECNLLVDLTLKEFRDYSFLLAVLTQKSYYYMAKNKLSRTSKSNAVITNIVLANTFQF